MTDPIFDSWSIVNGLRSYVLANVVLLITKLTYKFYILSFPLCPFVGDDPKAHYLRYGLGMKYVIDCKHNLANMS